MAEKGTSQASESGKTDLMLNSQEDGDVDFRSGPIGSEGDEIAADGDVETDVAIEAILNELDPSLDQDFADLVNPAPEEVAASGDGEIEEDEDLDVAESLEEEGASTNQGRFWQRWLRFHKEQLHRGILGLKNWTFFVLTWSSAQVRRIPSYIQSGTAKTKDQVNAVKMTWLSLSRAKKYIFLALLVTLGLLVGTLLKILSTGIVHPPDAYLLGDFRTVADRIYSYGDDATFEEYYSTLRLPEYIVLLEKIVVNLKPSASSSSNPMGTFQFYIEGTKREAAIEIKDREKEFLDVVQRVVEEIPYDDLRTVRGKKKLKVNIRNALNDLINNGRIRRVYIKHFITKP
jgi:flagellar basal body-associated protein FliL